MKVLNYKLCSSGIKEDKIQNKNKGMELRLPFKEGLILEINRLSLTRSSEGEEQEERILKSPRNAVWPVSERCAKILDGVEVVCFFNSKGHRLPSDLRFVYVNDELFGPHAMRYAVLPVAMVLMVRVSDGF